MVDFPQDQEAACLPVPGVVYQLAQGVDSLLVQAAVYQQGQEVACLPALAVVFQRGLAAACPLAPVVDSRPAPAVDFRMGPEIIGGA